MLQLAAALLWISSTIFRLQLPSLSICPYLQSTAVLLNDLFCLTACCSPFSHVFIAISKLCRSLSDYYICDHHALNVCDTQQLSLLLLQIKSLWFSEAFPRKICKTFSCLMVLLFLKSSLLSATILLQISTTHSTILLGSLTPLLSTHLRLSTALFLRYSLALPLRISSISYGSVSLTLDPAAIKFSP